jgi:hypothetical protein
MQRFLWRGMSGGCVAVVMALMSACSTITEEKRHSPEELARYRVADFVAPIVSATGEREEARDLLLAALPTLATKAAAYQRALLSSAHQLYFREAAPLLRNLLGEIATPREFAIAAYTILRANDDAATRAFVRDALLLRFADHATEPRLIALMNRLNGDINASDCGVSPLPLDKTASHATMSSNVERNAPEGRTAM